MRGGRIMEWLRRRAGRPALWTLPLVLLAALSLFGVGSLQARSARGDEPEAPRQVDYSHVRAPPAPSSQTQAQADAKSVGCMSCHTQVDSVSMHPQPSVVLGCTDCHGGDAAIHAAAGLNPKSPAYATLRDQAHVLPRYPRSWGYPSSANPKQSYTLLNKESPEFVRFKNPSDYRAARDACGACHLEVVHAAERSIMATGAMLLGGASYNNGILPYKNYVLGEAYTRDGQPAKILSPGPPIGTVTPKQAAHGNLPVLWPFPTWQVTPPADIFRVFERGGRNIGTQFPEIGLPDSNGELQKLEEPGRPDIRQSNRGPGTGLRVAIPLLNIHKTRLNDPLMWFLGTNDQPGDYRTSGCGACHVVYANDREPRHSLIYAQYGNMGMSQSTDPTIPWGESGHPLKHSFTRSIPTSQCMSCHMHQPNSFLNSYLGYTMWDYEVDAPAMWPKAQKYPTSAEQREILDRNPEGASVRGKWSDVDFLKNVTDLNPTLKETQFADYHGHGWNFRGIYKRDRKGNLLDAEGKIIPADDPEKWRKPGDPKFEPVGQNVGKAVHMMSVHAEVGMQCADCHFAQDSHGNGMMQGEVANAVEIGCKDCHGTADAYPTLRTSNVDARPAGTDLTALRNPDGQRRFEWIQKDGRQVLVQRSIVDPKLQWEVSLVKDSVDPKSPKYNEKSARAKLMSKIGNGPDDYRWGLEVSKSQRAHGDENMECYSCHLSWTTSCAGCHLPIEADWKTNTHHYEGEETRNFATYNPQVARDDMFQLGVHMTTKGHAVAPIRSSSALILSSTNINRERIYVQQPPISAIGFSSQAFAPHYPHTERRIETKTCTDCHVSKEGDNNAIMAQLLLLGTNTVNFIGLHAWVGEDHAVEAVRVSEYGEPQAVFGSYLQKYAYPDYYKLHVEKNHRELINWTRGRPFDPKHLLSSGETSLQETISNPSEPAGGAVNCIQLRGEYLFTAAGRDGLRVYDVASIGNKDISQRIITAPVSPWGQDTHVASRNATCVVLPTNQPIAPARNTAAMRAMNQEQAFHPIYNYALVTDSEEGLILVDVNTLNDREPRNNFLRRAVTWNPNGILKGARHATLAGHVAYVAADAGLVAVDLDDPLHPKLAAVVPLKDVRASAIQFRYLFVADGAGVQVLDVTHMLAPRLVPGATFALADARKIYLARTYAYVAAGADGLVILDIEKTEHPKLYQRVTLNGQLNDARDVIIGSTNASMFAYVADGKNGLKVLQLTSPDSQPNFYGFSPEPKPELIAWRHTRHPALALSRGLERDRAVDEGGGQVAVFGRVGSRPFTRPEMEKLFMTPGGQVFTVSDKPEPHGAVAQGAGGK